MTLVESTGHYRLAPDAAPGSPHLNNITPFPMAHCKADDAAYVTPEEAAEIERMVAGTPDSPAKRIMERLCQTVRGQRTKLLHLTEERDSLKTRVAELEDPLPQCARD